MTEPNKDPNLDPNKDPNAEPNKEPNADPNKEPNKDPKTLTEEEVNRIVQERVNKTKEKFADYDDLKTKLAEYAKLEEERKRSEQSDLENAQADITKRDEELNTTKAELDNLRAQLKQDKIDRAFEKAARAANIEYVDDAKRLADLSKVEITDEGVQGIAEIIQSLVDTKPFLIKKPEGQRQIGERSNQVNDIKSDKTAETLLREAAEKARRSGRMDDKLAYVNLKAELEGK